MTEIVAELSGVLYDKLSRTSRPVHLRLKGNAISVEPPDGGGGPGVPPSGPVDPGYGYPEKPVDPGYGIPGPPYPGSPPRPDHTLPGDLPHPAHPIVLPDPPTEGPPIDPPTNPPSPQWSWVYSRPYGWHPAYVPGPTDAQPH